MTGGLDLNWHDLYNVSDLRIKGPWVDARAYNGGGLNSTTLNAALAAIGGNSKTLYLAPGTWSVTANVTVPANVNLRFERGAVLSITSGITVTINGPMDAPMSQIFSENMASDNSSVKFGKGAIPESRPQWWGIGGGGDDSRAIQKAATSGAFAEGMTVRLSGAFTCKSPVHIGHYGTKLVGDGIASTIIYFNPNLDNQILFTFESDNPNICLSYPAVRDLMLYGADNHTKRKTGMLLSDSDTPEIRNVSILNWNGAGSIGLQIRGRQMGLVENVTIQADNPIQISKNLIMRNTTPQVGPIDLDHFTFIHLYLLPADDKASFEIDPGVCLTNVQFLGSNAFVGGKYGLHWDDNATTDMGASANLSVKNVRMEQEKTAGGAVIHIAHRYALYGLILENIHGPSPYALNGDGSIHNSGGCNGIYLRNCRSATIQNVTYTDNATALDIDNTTYNVVLINNNWVSGAVNTHDLVQTLGSNDSGLGGSVGHQVIAVYDSPNHDHKWIWIYGTKTWCYSGNLAVGGTISLPLGSGTGSKVGMALVAATNTGNTIKEAGTLMIASGTTLLVSGTANMVASDTAGKLCLISGGMVTLKNRMSSPVDVVVTLFWQ